MIGALLVGLFLGLICIIATITITGIIWVIIQLIRWIIKR